MSTLGAWLKNLLSRERRGAQRKDSISLDAYYWDGAAPVAHPVRDISMTGLYLVTEQRWYPGTMIEMTLQKRGVLDSEKDRSIRIMATVVWHGVDGVGFEFSLPHHNSNAAKDGDGKALKRFLR